MFEKQRNKSVTISGALFIVVIAISLIYYVVAGSITKRKENKIKHIKLIYKGLPFDTIIKTKEFPLI